MNLLGTATGQTWITGFRSRLRLPALGLLALLVSACGTTVNVDYDTSTNFAAIKSYSLETKPIKISDDPRIDNHLMQQRVVSAIHSNLQAKGLRASTPADARVTYRIDLKQEIESDRSGISVGVGTYSRNVGVGFGYGFPASDVESYDQMRLTIDLLRPDGSLLWRGSDTRRLYAGSTPEKSTELINDLVESILKEDPPN